MHELTARYIPCILVLAIVLLCSSGSGEVPLYSYAASYNAPVVGTFVSGLYPNEAVPATCRFSPVQSAVNSRPISQIIKEDGYQQSVPVNLLWTVGPLEKCYKCYSESLVIAPRYSWVQLDLVPAYTGTITFHSSYRLHQKDNYEVGSVDAGNRYSIWFQANRYGLTEVWYSLNGQDSTHVWIEV